MYDTNSHKLNNIRYFCVYMRHSLTIWWADKCDWKKCPTFTFNVTLYHVLIKLWKQKCKLKCLNGFQRRRIQLRNGEKKRNRKNHWKTNKIMNKIRAMLPTNLTNHLYQRKQLAFLTSTSCYTKQTNIARRLKTLAHMYSYVWYVGLII